MRLLSAVARAIARTDKVYHAQEAVDEWSKHKRRLGWKDWVFKPHWLHRQVDHASN